MSSVLLVKGEIFKRSEEKPEYEVLLVITRSDSNGCLFLIQIHFYIRFFSLRFNYLATTRY